MIHYDGALEGLTKDLIFRKKTQNNWRLTLKETLPSLLTTQALDQLIKLGNLEDLQEMYKNWPFFQSTVDLIEMVLAKADGTIAKYYDDVLVVNPEEKQLGENLRGRLDLTAEKILQVSGHEKLCENNKILRHLIDKRKPYIEPINILQVSLLRNQQDFFFLPLDARGLNTDTHFFLFRWLVSPGGDLAKVEGRPVQHKVEGSLADHNEWHCCRHEEQ